MTLLALDAPTEFEIRGRGQVVACVSGPYLRALSEANHYAAVYAQDEGAENVTIKRKIRRKPKAGE